MTDASKVPPTTGEPVGANMGERLPGEPRGPRLVVVGPPGAGKSTAGEAVAIALGVEFRDTDAVIVDVTGKSISDIFVDEGEPYFRALESATIAEQLADFDGVLALGGGAVLDPATRELLRGRTVAYLSVELADAMRRTGLDHGVRPLLALHPRATMRQMLEARRPLYEEVATFTVPTDRLTPDEVAANILKQVGG